MSGEPLDLEPIKARHRVGYSAYLTEGCAREQQRDRDTDRLIAEVERLRPIAAGLVDYGATASDQAGEGYCAICGEGRSEREPHEQDCPYLLALRYCEPRKP